MTTTLARLIGVYRLGANIPIVTDTRLVAFDNTDGQLVANAGVSHTITAPDGTQALATTFANLAITDGRVAYLWNTSALVQTGTYQVDTIAYDDAGNAYEITSLIKLE